MLLVTYVPYTLSTSKVSSVFDGHSITAHGSKVLIYLLKESGIKIDIVAFDECESGLKQWTSKTVMRNWRGNTFTLQGLMEIGERVIFADSFLSQLTE